MKTNQIIITLALTICVASVLGCVEPEKPLSSVTKPAKDLFRNGEKTHQYNK